MSCKKFHSALYARVVLTYFAGLLEGPVVDVNFEGYMEQKLWRRMVALMFVSRPNSSVVQMDELSHVARLIKRVRRTGRPGRH